MQKLERLGNEIGLGRLYVKRDDISAKQYGGNKVRKLEFLLGRALRNNARVVMTFGVAGSNHALATAINSNVAGIKCISMLLPQPNARYVRNNLLLESQTGAELHHYGNIRSLTAGAIYYYLRHAVKYGRLPYIIPAGGSSPLGTIGYVNAAFELREQIMKGEMPEPDLIYVSLGTMGTAAGLMLGLKAAGLKSSVVPVRVVDNKFGNSKGMARLFKETNRLLNSIEHSFPMFEITDRDIQIRHDFIGRGYALFTEEGIRAIDLAKKTEGLKLEGTYTGKALAALIHDAERNAIKDKVVLFWNTRNSRDFKDRISDADYRRLPRPFHRYFEKEVQQFDIS